MHRRNWDNLRYVLTVAEHGSVSGAAKVLGVNHATVLRRVAAFEADHGGPVFEKTSAGYRVLAGRANVIEAAREVENGMLSVERLMHGARAPLQGVVRVSSTDSFCQELLPPFVTALQRTAPDLRLDLLSTNAHLDFARMQADISVRPALRLPDEMTGEVAAHLAFGAFCAPELAEQPADAVPWLGLTGPLTRAAAGQWLIENIPPERIVAGSDSFLVLRAMAAGGMGVAILPQFVGAAAPGLRPRPDLIGELSTPVWVATYAELRDVPRIRVTCTRLIRFLDDRAAMLDGSGLDAIMKISTEFADRK